MTTALTAIGDWAAAAVPLAHAGHWYHSLIYAAPVLVLVLLLGIGTLRDRRKQARKERSENGEAAGDEGGTATRSSGPSR
jgi:hypothetical protein